MMISALRIVQKDEQNTHPMLKFFKKRVETGSNFWKLLFYSLKHVQLVVLIVLFAIGSSNINNAKNMGYMLFFMIYTAFEELFRKTAVLLIIFNSSFILAMYLFSFSWPLFYEKMEHDKKNNIFAWMNCYPNENSYKDPFGLVERISDFNVASPDLNYSTNGWYFEIKPVAKDWVMLIIMSILNSINDMYKQKAEISNL
jgi:hypothetical protein